MERYGLVALALHRKPAIQRLTKLQMLGRTFGEQSLSALPLSVGDVLLLRGPRADTADVPTPSVVSRRYMRFVALLWVLYFFAMFGCLMTFGHAAAMVSAVGGTGNLAAAGAMLVGAGSLVGSVVAGYFGDRVPLVRILLVSFAAAAVAMLVLWQIATPLFVLPGLTIVGLAYGALVGIMPAHVRIVFGPDLGFRAFSWIFLAWGAAGFLGPWTAGAIFDRTGEYRLAFVAGLVAIAAATAVTLSLRWLGSRRPGVILWFWPARRGPSRPAPSQPYSAAFAVPVDGFFR